MSRNRVMENEPLEKVAPSVFLYTGVDKFMGGGISGYAQTMELPCIHAISADVVSESGYQMMAEGEAEAEIKAEAEADSESSN